MISSLKPINLILFDTYILAILYLAITWQYINCNTHSNIWQLFYYLILLLRLLIDEAENNSILSKKLYYTLIFISSFVFLFGISTYEIVTIVTHPEDFDDPEHKSSCYQNRILLMAQCIFAYLICIKDVLVLLYDKSKEEADKEKATM